MKKYIACSFSFDGEDWQHCDEDLWLRDSEADFEGARKRVSEDAQESGDESVWFRYEVWVEDPDWMLKGDRAMYQVVYPDQVDGACFDNAETALQDISEAGGERVAVARLVRVATYGETEVSV